MADANVVLRIGSALGPGGFASLQAGIQMVGQFASKITESIKELDKFAVVMAGVDMTMINAADSFAKGQVDTFELMKGLQTLRKAGAEPTAEQFKVLTARAVDLAQATGQDATEAFKRLTTGIAKGSSRALTEYGIKLKESTDLSATQRTALKELTEGHGDLEVQIRTTTERLYALDNTLGTLTAAMWNAIPASTALGGALDSLNTTMSELSTWFTETPDTMKEMFFSFENLAVISREMGRSMTSMMIDIGAAVYRHVLGPVGQAVGAIADLAEMAGIDMSGAKDKIKSALSGSTGGDRDYFDKLRESMSKEREDAGADTFVGPDASGMGGGGKKKGGGGKGGGKGGGSEFDMEFSAEEAAAGYDSSLAGRVDASMADMAGYDTSESTIDALTGIGMDEQLDRAERLAEMQAQLAEQREDAAMDRDFRMSQMDSTLEIEMQLSELRAEAAVQREEDEIMKMFQMEQQLDFAEQFGDTWAASLRGISTGASTAGASMKIFNGVVDQAMHALITGSEFGAKAFWGMVAGVLEALAVEQAIKAITEGVAALISLAGGDAASAVLHGVAAAAAAAAAIVAGVAAAGANALAGGGGSSVSKPAASGAGAGAGGGNFAEQNQASSGEREPVKVIIQMAEDGFEAIVSKNNEAVRNGREGFATEAA